MASQFQMVMRTGPNPGQVFELVKAELYIGRDLNNDVVVNDSEISRKHARLLMQSGGYVLEDLGSTNGTYVNSQRLIGPHMLRPGETVMFGENVSLTYEAGYDADATVVAAPVQAPVYTPPPPRETYSPPPAPAPVQRPPAPQYQAPPVYQAPPQYQAAPAYSGQVPPGPAEPIYEEVQEEKKSNRPMIIAGCGCLVVLLCVVVVGAIVFDFLNLYCTAPFNSLFPCP